MKSRSLNDTITPEDLDSFYGINNNVLLFFEGLCQIISPWLLYHDTVPICPNSTAAITASREPTQRDNATAGSKTELTCRVRAPLRAAADADTQTTGARIKEG